MKTPFQKLKELGMSEEYAEELLQLNSKNQWSKTDLLQMVEILKEAYESIPDHKSYANQADLEFNLKFEKEFGIEIKRF